MAAAKKERSAPAPVPAGGSLRANEVVAAVGGYQLLDIKFWLESSSATSDEILGAARDWIAGAERELKRHH